MSRNSPASSPRKPGRQHRRKNVRRNLPRVKRRHAGNPRARRADAMPINILMPALSPTMEKGNLAKWIKKEGDKVAPGDVLAEIETDKATMEVAAGDEGALAKIVVPEGTQDVPVNELIAVLAGDGEDVKAAGASAGGAKSAPPAKAEAPKEEAKKEQAPAPQAKPMEAPKPAAAP